MMARVRYIILKEKNSRKKGNFQKKFVDSGFVKTLQEQHQEYVREKQNKLLNSLDKYCHEKLKTFNPSISFYFFMYAAILYFFFLFGCLKSEGDSEEQITVTVVKLLLEQSRLAPASPDILYSVDGQCCILFRDNNLKTSHVLETIISCTH